MPQLKDGSSKESVELSDSEAGTEYCGACSIFSLTRLLSDTHIHILSLSLSLSLGPFIVLISHVVRTADPASLIQRLREQASTNRVRRVMLLAITTSDVSIAVNEWRCLRRTS